MIWINSGLPETGRAASERIRWLIGIKDRALGN
jgi:hypothetical protein